MGKKKTSKTSILVLLSMCVLLSAGMLYAYFAEDDQETTTVSGIFDDFKEEKRRVNKSRKTFYYLYLNGTKYNIPRIYKNALNKESFLTEVKKGDSLTLIIKGSKSIYQITKGNTKFMDINRVKEDIESNNFMGLILGCFFIGCVVYLVFVYLKL